MPVMLERWNDDKMDGLSEKVDGLGVRSAVLEGKVALLAQELQEQRREMRAGFDRIDGRFDRLYHVLVVAAAAIVAAVIGAPHL